MDETAGAAPEASTPIEGLILYTRTYRGLRNNGFRTVDDLLQFCAEDWLKYVWCGPDTLSSIEKAVAAVGFRLPDESAPWVRELLRLDKDAPHGLFRRALLERNGVTDESLDKARYPDSA